MPKVFDGLGVDFGGIGDSWSLSTLCCGIVNGLLIGEFHLIAFWMLMEPISLLRKLLLGSCAGFSLAACLVIGSQVWEGMPQAAAIFLWLVGIVLPFAFAVGLLVWSVLIRTNALPLQLWSGNAKQVQYGVRFLLISTVVVAVAFSLIRVSLPSNQDRWLSALELGSLVFWFIWLVSSTSLFAWMVVTTIMRSTLFLTGVVVLLTIFGPVFFQLIASMVLLNRFAIQFRLWAPIPHAMAIGLLISAGIIGLVFRACSKTQ